MFYNLHCTSHNITSFTAALINKSHSLVFLGQVKCRMKNISKNSMLKVDFCCCIVFKCVLQVNINLLECINKIIQMMCESSWVKV